MTTPTKRGEEIKHRLGVLLMDVFLKNEHKDRYPIGQLEKRVGEFIDEELASTRIQVLADIIARYDKKIEESKKEGLELLAKFMIDVRGFALDCLNEIQGISRTK